MPEGDAVLRTARLLDRGLSGRTLAQTDFRVPQLATVDLAGGAVAATVARGKHLLTRIDHESGRWTLHTHLLMDGSWRVLRPGQRWPKPAHLARVVLEAEGATAVGFQLGVVELVAREEEEPLLAHLGPDLLGPDWDLDEALHRLSDDPDRPVFEALRDQRNLAGIGTIYAAETQFLSGVHPLTPVGQVPDLRRLVARTGELLRAEWSTKGRMWVYGRRDCRRCGGTVQKLMLGPVGRERPAYVCPRCQPLR